MLGDRWFVLTKAGQAGPYSADELAGLLEQGDAAWSTLVWRKGLSTWKPARRDEVLVMAVAGTLGLGNKTVRVDGLSALMHAESAPEAPSDWLVDDEDDTDATCVEAWPLGLQRQATPPRGVLAVYTPSPAPSAALPARLAGVEGRRVPPLPASPGASPSLRLSLPPHAPPSVGNQAPLLGSSPTLLTLADSVAPTHETPTGRYPQSSYAPRANNGGRATWIAVVAFAAGAAMAIASSRLTQTAPPGSSRPQAGKTASAAVAAPLPVRALPNSMPARSEVSPPESAAPLSAELVKRALPALDEVRVELRRVAAPLRRCLRPPALGLLLDVHIEGASGRIEGLEVLAPALTAGRLECVKEALSDVRIAPFEQPSFRLKHRYVW